MNNFNTADKENLIDNEINNIPTQRPPVGIKPDLNFEIKGENSQFIELTLKPGQTITGEITALMYFETGIVMKMKSSASLDSGGEPVGFISKLLGMSKAAISGQKLFMMSFTNSTQKELKIAFSMPYSGTIIPINLSSLGNELFCQNNSFLCATNDLRMTNATARELGSNTLNDATHSIQKIQGGGMLFLFCGGSILQRKIAQGETLNVTTGTALAMQSNITFKNKTIRNVGLTGKGHSLTEISGTGYVWLQSLPYTRTKDNIIENVGLFFGIKQKKQKLLGK